MSRITFAALSIGTALALLVGHAVRPAAGAAPVDEAPLRLDSGPVLICADLHFSQSRTLRCPGSNKRMLCTRQCTTYRAVDNSTVPATCVTESTVCEPEVCDFASCG